MKKSLTPPASLARLLVLPGLSILIAVSGHPARANTSNWPKGYEIHEKSESPDGRFGVLVPTQEQGIEMEEEKITNALVDLITRHQIAAINGAHYFAQENHNSLEVSWAPDSNLCVVTYEGRFGFDSITALKMSDGECKQGSLGGHIQKALDGVIAQQAGDGTTCRGCASAYFRFDSEGNILVRASGTTNPKGMEDEKTYCAFFQGTFNSATGKWTGSAARKMDNTVDLYAAFSNSLLEDETFGSDENRLSSFDDLLNQVYQAVRAVLPKDQFAAIKKEQIAWLKTLEACKTADQKCELMAARTKELRELAWKN